MHELSIVQNIIKIVAIEAKNSGVERVTEVNLEIGQLSGIEFSSLEFAFKNLSPGSVIEGAEIYIEKPGGTARCSKCGNEFSIDTFLGSCNLCNSFDLEIIRGKELRVKSITIN
ncbi:MAG TPA: hydrogenase maturation nickel metallochaperone HypA [Bacteroidales bacterium]|nr:hydrogenase maturation nickel metallochaperone HypA [Bacteroidales bacterium]